MPTLTERCEQAKQDALRAPLLTAEEKAAHRSAVAAVAARDASQAGCHLCHQPMTDSVPYWAHPGCDLAKVCQSCAEVVANAFNRQHSGRWLTWAEAPAAARKPRKKGDRA